MDLHPNLHIKLRENLPYFISFIVAMIGLWLFCWGLWGGSITVREIANPLEAGLGLNPP